MKQKVCLVFYKELSLVKHNFIIYNNIYNKASVVQKGNELLA